ncbi:MAG TPA: macro domain-containing protein [Candidatus Limnocylindrales bacterium]|nr:macro domain-containing protein [Candidatus Limnocylindrales bacterium]
MEITLGPRRLELRIGDITTEAVDAIGNAANASLRGGGGVDGAIHAAAGPGLLAELRQRYPNGTPTGTAVATSGHRLPARWVIHAVGPVWHGGERREPGLLTGAYGSTLELAEELGARTLALPAISMGIYGYPIEEGARIAIDSVLASLREASTLELVRFVLRPATWDAFTTALSAGTIDVRASE